MSDLMEPRAWFGFAETEKDQVYILLPKIQSQTFCLLNFLSVLFQKEAKKLLQQIVEISSVETHQFSNAGRLCKQMSPPLLEMHIADLRKPTSV